MEIKIKMLNVGDAESIIVSLQKEAGSFIILIDGGLAKNSNDVIKAINKELKDLGKKTIDLIICTHYDADHIAGIIKVVKYYDKLLRDKEIWVFDTSNFTASIKPLPKEKSSILPSEKDRSVNSSVETSSTERYRQSLIQTVEQEQQLIKLAKEREMIIKQPLADTDRVIPTWNIKVIGPTKDYYYELFPEALKEKPMPEEIKAVEETDVDPCKEFNLKKSPVTKPNLGSAILLLEIGEKKYLFAGDAGIDSFYAIPDYKNLLSNIFWLKVPHHGSKNNINCDLINIMKPQVVAVSGDRYVSENLLKCLQSKGANVYSTKENGDLHFVNGEIIE